MTEVTHVAIIPHRNEDNGGHGGDVYSASEASGIPAAEILDFSASINPLGVPPSVRAAIREHIPLLDRYPDSTSRDFRKALERLYGLDRSVIVCGNGSTEIIYLTVRALRPRNVLIPAPTFSEYERACLWDGATVRHHALDERDRFDMDPESFVDAMRGCDMAFLCNPNNPTGRLVRREDMLRIAEGAIAHECLLVVDEAFIDFCPDHSLIQEVEENPFLVVMRSLTKFYALSGLRLGYGVFPSQIVEKVLQAKEPWTVNTLAQRAGIAAIHDKAYAGRSRSLMSREKVFLERELAKLGIEHLPSPANYYLLRHDRAPVLAAALRGKGILVRDCSNFPGLDRSYLRVAVRSRRENRRFIQGLSGLCAES